MSKEGVDAVRGIHEAFNAHDRDRFVAAWHPDCEYRPAFEGALEGGGATFHGHEGIRRWWGEMREAWSEWSIKLEDIRDLGNGRLLVSIVLRVRAEASGLDLEGHFFQLTTFRDGRFTSSRDFSNREAALEAAGLSE